MWYIRSIHKSVRLDDILVNGIIFRITENKSEGKSLTETKI